LYAVYYGRVHISFLLAVASAAFLNVHHPSGHFNRYRHVGFRSNNIFPDQLLRWPRTVVPITPQLLCKG